MTHDLAGGQSIGESPSVTVGAQSDGAATKCGPLQPGGDLGRRRPRRAGESFREWLLEVDPDLWHAAQEVDFTLLKDQLALSPLERVAICTRAVSGLGAFRRSSR